MSWTAGLDRAEVRGGDHLFATVRMSLSTPSPVRTLGAVGAPIPGGDRATSPPTDGSAVTLGAHLGLANQFLFSAWQGGYLDAELPMSLGSLAASRITLMPWLTAMAAAEGVATALRAAVAAAVADYLFAPAGGAGPANLTLQVASELPPAFASHRVLESGVAVAGAGPWRVSFGVCTPVGGSGPCAGWETLSEQEQAVVRRFASLPPVRLGFAFASRLEADVVETRVTLDYASTEMLDGRTEVVVDSGLGGLAAVELFASLDLGGSADAGMESYRQWFERVLVRSAVVQGLTRIPSIPTPAFEAVDGRSANGESSDGTGPSLGVIPPAYFLAADAPSHFNRAIWLAADFGAVNPSPFE
jgi:hypothetical protein